jgi:predicted transcriptional regulator
MQGTLRPVNDCPTDLYRLSDAEREGIERGLKAMREGRFVSDERMANIFEKAHATRL